MGQSWIDYRDLIIEEINKRKHKGSPKELYDSINYILSLGGKRIRPVLCLMAAKLFGSDPKSVLSMALGIEVFHNFTLVHDDIMDEAPLRRGNPTVHEKWNRDIAILSGDVMLVKAYELICESKTDYLSELLTLFNKTAIEVCEGQQFDMNFELEPEVTIPDYIEMIRLKTAVLLACSLKMGAITAGANKEDANLIYEFGQNIGIAFQIQDDYLDAYGDSELFGKRVGGDIISNKKTYLLLSALNQASLEQKERLNYLLVSEKNEKIKVEGVLDLFNRLNVPETAKKEMEKHYELGMRALADIQQAVGNKKELQDLAQMLMLRKQ